MTCVVPGDIIVFNNGLNSNFPHYVFELEYHGSGVLGINACNLLWVNKGLKFYGEECFILDDEDFATAQVIDHFGNGRQEDGICWYGNYYQKVINAS